MKKTLVAVMIGSIILAGCGGDDEEKAKQQAYLDQLSQQQAMVEAQAEKNELAGVVEELKKGDPLIRDAYYGYNEKGDRVLHVIRDEPAQPQQPQYQQGPSGQPVIINNQQPQQAHSGTSETIWPLLAGAGAGMLLANAMNSGGGFGSYSRSHQPYGYHHYDDDSDYRRNRTTVINQYNTRIYSNTRAKIQSSPTFKSDYKSFTPTKSVATPAPASKNGYWSSQAKTQPTTPAVTQPKQSSWGTGSSWSSSNSQPAQVSQPKAASSWNSSSSQAKTPSSSSSSWGSSSSRSSGSSWSSGSSRSSSSSSWSSSSRSSSRR